MLSKHQTIQKRLKLMDEGLKLSFANLKTDLSNQSEAIKELKGELAHQREINQGLSKEIADIHAKLDGFMKSVNHTPSQETRTEVFGERSVRSADSPASVLRTPNVGLTPLHIEMLRRLMLIQMENGRRAISMRELAAELYPTRDYSKIKSTVSEYVNRLNQAGLVEKVRNGKLYLSYTREALKYADDHRLNRMQELILRPLGNCSAR